MTERVEIQTTREKLYTERKYTLVADTPDRIKPIWLGSASYLIFNNPHFNWVEIVNLFVEEEYRNHGYAEALLRLILRDIKTRIQGKSQNLFLLIERDNYYALKLYNKLGFRVSFEIENEGDRYLVLVNHLHSNSLYQLKGKDLVSLYS